MVNFFSGNKKFCLTGVSNYCCSVHLQFTERSWWLLKYKVFHLSIFRKPGNANLNFSATSRIQMITRIEMERL